MFMLSVYMFMLNMCEEQENKCMAIGFFIFSLQQLKKEFKQLTELVELIFILLWIGGKDKLLITELEVPTILQHR